LAADYATNPEGLKSLLAAMPVNTSIVQNLTDAGSKTPEWCKDKKWDDLSDNEKKKLKAENVEYLKHLYSLAFNKPLADKILSSI
jgi:hypothetical protein